MITAVLTRPRGDSEPLAEALQAEGVQTVILPLMTIEGTLAAEQAIACLLYTSPSPRDRQKSRMPSSA